MSEARQDATTPDLAGTWRQVQDELRAALPDSTFKLWVEPLRIVAVRGSTLYLSAPRQIRVWVERRYSELLADAVGAHAEFSEIRFVDEGDPLAADSSQCRAAAKSALNPAHTFERFVIGPGNRLAHAAALAVAEAPAEAYNPLFLHGPPGLGKTHLLGAIANYLRKHGPDLAVHYTTAECFTNGFVAALQTKELEPFKDTYRRADVLLVDDVQFLEGKTHTADELFHTFNALYESGSQIVLSSDRLPSELSELAQRLRDRFDWGLVAELRPPDELTRITFLNRLSQEERISPEDPEALGALARHATENLRLLRGALTRVVAMSSLTDSPITRDLVTRVLPDSSAADPAAAAVSAASVQEAVAAELEVDLEEILSPIRRATVVEARQVAMYLTRELTNLSLPQIARAFHRRDHTTVIHAIKRVEDRLTSEPALSVTLESIRVRLRARHSILTDSGERIPEPSS